jgi:dihydroneopterin aldolase
LPPPPPHASCAGATGDLGDTIDYARAYSDIRDIMEGEPVQLLEALAARIVARLFAADSRVAAITVRIQKPHVAVRGPVEYLGVEISRTRPPPSPPSPPSPAPSSPAPA